MVKLIVYFVVLFSSCSTLFASEGAKVTHVSGSTYALRSFEQFYLSDGASIGMRDVVVVDSGILELVSGKTRLAFGEGSKLKIRKEGQMVMTTLLEGKVFIDARVGGSSWFVDSGGLAIKGDGGALHLEKVDDGVEMAVLNHEAQWKCEGSTKWKTVGGNRAGKWPKGSLALQYLRDLSSFEVQTYEESMISKVVLAGEMLLTLDGQPFVPYQDMKVMEANRRKGWDGQQEFHGVALLVDKEKNEKLKKTMSDMVQETVSEEIGFEFIVPKAPPPPKQ